MKEPGIGTRRGTMPRMVENLPSAKGSYALLFGLARPVKLMVGRLGEFSFDSGIYFYTGSAKGSGGLKARVNHHLRVTEHPHWHLDWLRPHLDPISCCYAISRAALECTWSSAIQLLLGVQVPAPGFGASDCSQGCGAHLLNLPDLLRTDNIQQFLQDSSNCQVFVIMSL